MTYSIWKLMNCLPIFKNYQKENIENTEWFADRAVNIPSNVVI